MAASCMPQQGIKPGKTHHTQTGRWAAQHPAKDVFAHISPPLSSFLSSTYPPTHQPFHPSSEVRLAFLNPNLAASIQGENTTSTARPETKFSAILSLLDFWWHHLYSSRRPTCSDSVLPPAASQAWPQPSHLFLALEGTKGPMVSGVSPTHQLQNRRNQTDSEVCFPI